MTTRPAPLPKGPPSGGPPLARALRGGRAGSWTRSWPLVLVLVSVVLGASSRGVADDAQPPTGAEEARKAAIDSIRRDLHRWAQTGHPEEVKADVLKGLESLATLGGPVVAKVALEAVPLTDPEIRDRVFAIVEKERPKDLVKPLVALTEDRRFKRDFDLHRRVIHALSVIADVSAIEPLTAFLLSEDHHVVASAADALGTFASAPHRLRVEPVRRMIDLYESTWNLMNSIRPEDRVAAKDAKDRWEIYGKSLRTALQALARQTITRAREWRDWWNDHKKDPAW